MEETDKNTERGFGKYVLISKIKEKHPLTFLESEEADMVLTSTSVLLEGIHFNLVYFPLKHLGYKAVISSIADIYSKNGLPEYISVSIGISSRFSYEDVETIIEGIEVACKNYNLKVADLNIDSSLTGLTLAVTASGSSDNTFADSSATSDTDIIAVSGDLGAAFMGLQLLERERKVFEDTGGGQPQLEGKEYVIGRQMKPEIDITLLDTIKKAGLNPTSIKVLKEGLASDLIGLAAKYQLGCRLYHEKIPYTQETSDAGNEFNIEPLIASLSGGDDFEFMFSFSVNDFEKIKDIEKLTIVGHFTPQNEGNTLALQDNSLAELKAQGWEE